jgi:hypothetical protein
MENVVWGIPTQRTKKVEKFNTPVITMSAIAEGTGRKFSFNKAAQETLGLVKGESHVALGFHENNIYVKSLVKETPTSFKLTNTHTFSNKKTFEYIAKVQELDTSIENYLHIEAVDGQPMCKVVTISTDGGSTEGAYRNTEEEGKETEVEVEIVETEVESETITNNEETWN